MTTTSNQGMCSTRFTVMHRRSKIQSTTPQPSMVQPRTSMERKASSPSSVFMAKPAAMTGMVATVTFQNSTAPGSRRPFSDRHRPPAMAATSRQK